MQQRHEKCTRRAVCENVCVCVCVSLCPRCACMHEIGRARLTPVHQGLYFSTLPHSSPRLQISPHLHRSAPVSAVQKPPSSTARVLNAVLPPLGCLPGLNVPFWLDIDTLFSCFCFLLCCVSHFFNSRCLCGGNHLLGCGKGERGREPDEEGESRGRGSKEQEEREKWAEGERAGVACRLEIIGVRTSGRSVVFVFDAVVQHVIYTPLAYSVCIP